MVPSKADRAGRGEGETTAINKPSTTIQLRFRHHHQESFTAHEAQSIVYASAWTSKASMRGGNRVLSLMVQLVAATGRRGWVARLNDRKSAHLGAIRPVSSSGLIFRRVSGSLRGGSRAGWIRTATQSFCPPMYVRPITFRCVVGTLQVSHGLSP